MNVIKDESKTEIICLKASLFSKTCQIVKKVSVEPLLFVSLFVIVMYSIISQQFIYQQFSVKYGLDNFTQSSACHSNLSNETKVLHNKVSIETSNWVLYLNIAGILKFSKYVIFFDQDVAYL